MANIKTYILVPHHDFRADGPVVLGSIITDLLDPGDSLNKESIVEIPSRYTSHKQDWEHTIEFIREGRAGVWARYLSFLGIGGNFGASFDTKTTDHYRIKDLETTYFSPTQAYVEEAVNKPEVRSYLKGSRYAPIYMITGVKIARGPGSEIISKKSLRREGHAQFSLSVAGSPLALDAGDMMLHDASVDNTSFRGSSDFVIGFRLVKITFHETADGVRVPEQQKHIDGAMLSIKEGQTKGESYATITVKVRFDGDEAVADELREEDLITAIDEDDNQECRCFVLPLTET
jgi:hypothetical protein